MKYPTNEDEIFKSAAVAWITERFDMDEVGSKHFLKMHLIVAELRERGFSWTDI